MTLLKEKTILILGIASNRSIAFHIAKKMVECGASVLITYPNDHVKERILKLANQIGALNTYPCDVSSDDEINALIQSIKNDGHRLDSIVHSVAYAPSDQIQGRFTQNINREGFAMAQDISAYSFAAIVKSALPILNENASCMTMTFIGSQRTVPNYNVMGVAKASLEATTRYLAYDLGQDKIRVNAVSPGPVRTLAAAGIQGFKQMLNRDAEINPIPGNTGTDEIANVCAFLASELSQGMTGQTLYIDHGYHLLGAF